MQIPTSVARRDFLIGAASAGISLATGSSVLAAHKANSGKPDHTLRITPVSLELAPRKVIKTFGYNGAAPGPVLRLKEGRPVTIQVINETDVDDIVHWHGLFVPSDVDGAMEEGTPMVPRGGSRVYTFTPKPAGTRWYHSHAFAGKDLSRSTYSGMFGFLIVEPTSDPGHYDQEILLAAHHWEGSWVSMQDIRKGPPPDNGLEVMYAAASFNSHALGSGDPIRVRQGQRVLFRFLNASGSEAITLALPGHRFTIVALDGNPIANPQSVDVLSLGVAERIDAIVEMNRPGVWILGSTEADVRKSGLGTVIEYANQSGEPRWSDPPKSAWDYSRFSRGAPTGALPGNNIELVFEKIPGGRGGYNRWTINGKSWPKSNPLFQVEKERRYRVKMKNNSGDTHPVHLHRHTFEVVRVGDKPTSGIFKDTLNMSRFSTAEIEFVADNPGPTLFHCHQQDHQDEGFMGLITYR